MHGNLFFERIGGEADGPVLVFLHHGLGSVGQWKDFPRQVCSSLGLAGLVYDRLGHGRSPEVAHARRPDYLQSETAALAALLEETKIHNFVLVGHSDGATIALLYAAETRFASPRCVVSIAAHAFVEEITREGIRSTIQAWRSPRFRDGLARYHGKKAEALFWNWAGGWLSPAFDAFDIRDRLKQVHCPVLAIQGDMDEYGSKAQLDAISASCSGPVQVLTLPGCGHEPHFDNPDATASAIERFVSSLR